MIKQLSPNTPVEGREQKQPEKDVIESIFGPRGSEGLLKRLLVEKTSGEKLSDSMSLSDMVLKARPETRAGVFVDFMDKEMRRREELEPEAGWGDAMNVYRACFMATDDMLLDDIRSEEDERMISEELENTRDYPNGLQRGIAVQLYRAVKKTLRLDAESLSQE